MIDPRLGVCTLSVLLLAVSCAGPSRSALSPSIPESIALPVPIEPAVPRETAEECGPRAPDVLVLRPHPERTDAVIVTVSPWILGRVRVRPLEPANALFEGETGQWESMLTRDSAPIDRVLILDRPLAPGGVAVQLEAFTESGEHWFSLDASIPATGEPRPAPIALVRHAVVLPLPGGGSCVEYMTQSEANARGLEIAVPTESQPLETQPENGGDR